MPIKIRRWIQKTGWVATRDRISHHTVQAGAPMPISLKDKALDTEDRLGRDAVHDQSPHGAGWRADAHIIKR